VAEVNEPAREVGTDKPGAPGNKDSLGGHGRIVSDGPPHGLWVAYEISVVIGVSAVAHS
jgi:hypothetical protein